MNNLAILIVSCDKYEDLWEPFFQCFWKFWPNCPYPVYLETNNKRYTGTFASKVQSIRTGTDKDWSSNVNIALQKIPEEYIFMWNEDLFFSSSINTKVFDKFFRAFEKLDGNHAHYTHLPLPDRYTNDRLFGVYDKGAPYRSIVMGFWKKSYLEKLLLPGETPWNFEILGSYRTQYDDGFYCVNDTLVTFAHMMEKGKWLAKGVFYCKTNNIPIVVSARPLTRGRTLISVLQMHYFATMLHVPWRLRVRVMNIMRKAFVSY